MFARLFRAFALSVLALSVLAPLPVAQAAGGPPRVSFDRGATNGVVSGSLAANETKTYVLRALADQVMFLNTTSSTNGVRVSVVGSGKGEPTVLSQSSDGANWTGRLPATQDYVVSVSANNNAATFSVNITIPRRITFKRGATSAAVTGSVVNRRTLTYILRAAKGQTMTATLATPQANTMALTLYGLSDGQPLVRAGGAGVSSWTGTLPGNQDYIIQAVPGVDSTAFTLSVTVK